jgi:hypothetical protein
MARCLIEPRSQGGEPCAHVFRRAPIASTSKARRCADASSLVKALLHNCPCTDRPRGPQRLPTRAVLSLVRARRDVRGSPPWTPWTILCRLDRHYPFLQPIFVSTAQIAATLTPTQSAASRRDHDHRNR